MSKPVLQLALREWLETLRRPKLWASLIAIGCLLALIGPFGTGDILSLPAAFAYWFAIAVMGYAAGSIVTLVTDHVASRLSATRRILLNGVLIGLIMFALVTALNYATFAILPQQAELPVVALTIIAISVLVSFLLEVSEHEGSAEGTASRPPAILDRVPLDKRGGVVALSVEDHYVRVITRKGETLVLLRLADAMREVTGLNGAQVHRSHWVCFDEVRAARRNNAGAILTLSTGQDIPVSRSNMPKIKEAGLLPR